MGASLILSGCYSNIHNIKWLLFYLTDAVVNQGQKIEETERNKVKTKQNKVCCLALASLLISTQQPQMNMDQIVTMATKSLK